MKEPFNDDPDTTSTGHYGKGMMEMDGDRVIITLDCVKCGRMKCGPIDPLHLRTMATLLNRMADSLGVDDYAVSRVVEEKTVHPETQEEFNAVKGTYDTLPTHPTGNDISKAIDAVRKRVANFWGDEE